MPVKKRRGGKKDKTRRKGENQKGKRVNTEEIQIGKGRIQLKGMSEFDAYRQPTKKFPYTHLRCNCLGR
jgi:hypothetical protein